MLTTAPAYVMVPTRYADEEPCTWPIAVYGPGGSDAGRTDRGTADGTTSYQGREYRLVPCDHAPHWTYLVPVTN